MLIYKIIYTDSSVPAMFLTFSLSLSNSSFSDGTFASKTKPCAALARLVRVCEYLYVYLQPGGRLPAGAL